MNPLTDLREEVIKLRQVLEGFAGTVGLIATVNDNTRRLGMIERNIERAKGAYGVIALLTGGAAGIVTGTATVLLSNHWSR